MMAPFAIEVAAALPGTDRREMGRLQRGDLPLLDRKIRDAEQADFAGRPGLPRCPFDGVVEILGLARRERLQEARRFAAAAGVDRDDDIAMRHPALGIGVLPAQIATARAVARN